MTFGVHSEVGQLRKVIVHRPGLEHSRLTPSTAQELLFDDVLWVSRAKAEHDMFCEAMRERGVEVFLAEELLADDARRRRRPGSGSATTCSTSSRSASAPRRGPGSGRARRGRPGRRLPDRRHHQGRRRPGPRADLGVGRPDQHAAAAAAELPVPARPVVLDLRRRHAQPDDEAGPQARDAHHGGDLPLPPDVRGGAVPDLAGWRRARTGAAPTSRAATCSRSATARS